MGPRSGSGYSAGKYSSVRIIDSRHLDDMTEKYPDICQLILTLLTRPLSTASPFPASVSEPSQTALDLLKAEKIESFIMDAEVVAVDKDTGAYRTFQDLSNRAKKDVRVEDIKVIVGIYAFDLMLLNDRVRSVTLTPLTVSHCWNCRSLIGVISCVPCSRRLQTHRILSWLDSLTSKLSTRQTAKTFRPKCKRSSRRSWSRNVKA
jgi:hypothetical protein